MAKSSGSGGMGRRSVNASLEAQRRRKWALLKLGGIGAAVVAAIAFLVQANFGLTGGVAEVGLNETDVLRQIFFSGEPWLVQCIGPGNPLDSTFAAAAPHLAANKEPYSVVKTATLSCGDKLPSGMTVYQRFKLNENTKPLVALFANGEKPQVVSKDALEMAATLVKRVSEASKLRIADVSTPGSFGRVRRPPSLTHSSPTRCPAAALAPGRSAHPSAAACACAPSSVLQACLSKLNKVCVMLFPYTGLSAEQTATLRAVAAKFRTVRFAIINTDNVEISIERGLPAREDAESESYLRVAASRVFPDSSAQALAYRGAFEEGALGAWLAEIASGETELNMLSKKPSASRRRRARDPNEDEATRQERRRQRKSERKAAEAAIQAAAEEVYKTLTPEERAQRMAEIKARQVEWERKRRDEMIAEEGSSSIFDNDEDEDDEDDDEDDEVEEVADAAEPNDGGEAEAEAEGAEESADPE